MPLRSMRSVVLAALPVIRHASADIAGHGRAPVIDVQVPITLLKLSRPNQLAHAQLRHSHAAQRALVLIVGADAP
jgi:hypothetical protein